MTKLFVFFLLALATARASSASVSSSCESVFKATNVAQAGALEFPNTADARKRPLSSVAPGAKKSDIPVTAVEAHFNEALAQAAEHSSLLKPEQFLPMTLTSSRGGLQVIRTLDWNALVGQNIVGVQLVKHEMVDRLENGPYQNLIEEHLYFAGTVIEAGITDYKFHVTVKTPSGEDLRIQYQSGSPYGVFLIVAEKKSPQEWVRYAFEKSSMEKLVENAFGSPTVKEDYDMAAAIVETAIAVPVTYGASAVIKILQGRTVRGGESYANYGLARGKKRYSEKNLIHFVGSLYGFMTATGVMAPEVRDTQGDGPDWLQNFDKSDLAGDFKNIWQELRAAKGGADVVVVEKKARKAGNLKLARDVATPGTKIVVTKPGFWVGDQYAQHVSYYVDVGATLEIVKAPRTVRADGVGLSLMRVRDPQTGKEGEVFWSEAIKGATLIAE